MRCCHGFGTHRSLRRDSEGQQGEDFDCNVHRKAQVIKGTLNILVDGEFEVIVENFTRAWLNI